MRLHHLDGHRGGLAAPNAQRRHTALATGFFQRAEQRDDDTSAGGTDRMTERAGAAMNIQAVMRHVVLFHGGHRNSGKRLVDFEQIHVFAAPAGFLVQLLDRADGCG